MAQVAIDAPAGVLQSAGSRRGQLFTLLGVVVVVLALAYGVWWLMVGSRYVSTDNAYVDADVAQVTPLVSGAVQEVRVADTQAVKKGDVLVVIDPADARLEVEQAEAALGQAERRVRQDFATDDALGAQVAARATDIAHAQAQLAEAQAALDKAKIDYDRRQSLVGSGAVSGDELTVAKSALDGAKASYAAAVAGVAQAQANRATAEGQLRAGAALVQGADLEHNPDVASAQSKLDQAKLDLARTVITAPIDGVVSKRAVQVGQRVPVGAQLMTVVPIGRVYVDANYKEVELSKVRAGQPVELTSDLYGDHVKYHGRVAGFSGGTGAAFSLIPAQNATGNWIKVVQRLPVRVELDPRELAAHPLRVGLSMKARIDVRGGTEASPARP
jgi:membrane fusion protein (multidrug efflux system)